NLQSGSSAATRQTNPTRTNEARFFTMEHLSSQESVRDSATYTQSPRNRLRNPGFAERYGSLDRRCVTEEKRQARRSDPSNTIPRSTQEAIPVEGGCPPDKLPLADQCKTANRGARSRVSSLAAGNGDMPRSKR